MFFLPHDPARTRLYISHTNILLASTATVACLLIWAFRDTLESRISYSFLPQLAAFVVLFVNLDFLESYWLAIQQPKSVFIYSTVRTLTRLGAVIAAAYTGSVPNILAVIIAVELLRVFAVLIVMHHLRLLYFGIDGTLLKKQLAFIVPLGLASCLHYTNEAIGQLVISMHLGVVALATYTIASYQVPLLAIARGAISDAIFPGMVRQAAGSEHDRLLLWKRGNIAYSSLIIPIVVALIWYADVLIPFVFSAQYANAVPIARVLLLVLVIQCFEFSSPLRAANRTVPLLLSNVLLILVNVTCILLYFRFVTENLLLGPAIAIIVAYLAQLTFLGAVITRVYSITASQLLKWRSLGAVFGCAAVGSIVLLVGEWLPMPPLLRLVVFSSLYFGCYLLLVLAARIEEVEILLRAFCVRFRAVPTAVS